MSAQQMNLVPVDETWDAKMHRLAVRLQELRAEVEFMAVDDKRRSKLQPEFRALRYEIDLHMRSVLAAPPSVTGTE